MIKVVDRSYTCKIYKKKMNIKHKIISFDKLFTWTGWDLSICFGAY